MKTLKGMSQRETLAHKLKLIRNRIDTTPERVVDRKWSHWYHLDLRGPVRIRFERVWLHGSYARGAAIPDDINVIVKSSMEWDWSRTRSKARRSRPIWGKAQLPPSGRVMRPVLGA